MSPILKKIPVVLASASPRRKRLLEKSGVEIVIAPSGIDEDAFYADKPEEFVKTLSRAKADDVSLQYPGSWVIGADSVVAIGDNILNKPVSRADAHRMLTLLSGRIHRVLTGYSIINRDRSHFFTEVEITDVTFKQLDPGEIEWYLDTPEPYDKAGAYAIQGIGAFMVKKINGSYTNVVGLPLSQVIDHLLTYGATQYTGEPTRSIAGCMAGSLKDGGS